MNNTQAASLAETIHREIRSSEQWNAKYLGVKETTPAPASITTHATYNNPHLDPNNFPKHPYKERRRTTRPARPQSAHNARYGTMRNYSQRGFDQGYEPFQTTHMYGMGAQGGPHAHAQPASSDAYRRPWNESWGEPGRRPGAINRPSSSRGVNRPSSSHGQRGATGVQYDHYPLYPEMWGTYHPSQFAQGPY